MDTSDLSDDETGYSDSEETLVSRRHEHFLRRYSSSERIASDFSQLSEHRPHDYYESYLTEQGDILLETPSREWTIELLKSLAVNPQVEGRDRGWYLLVAMGKKLEKQAVELYIGSSDNMAKRFTQHVGSINSATRAKADIQYFHRRCLRLKVSKPLFIPLSVVEGDHADDELELLHQESAHIAIIGTWERLELGDQRHRIWSDVRAMRLPGDDGQLPPGWHGANREIPFNPTCRRKRY